MVGLRGGGGWLRGYQGVWRAENKVRIRIACGIILGLICFCATSARAAFILGGGEQFAVLGQFSSNQTNFNNGVINGDIGMGSPRQATFSNVTVNGSVR